MLTDSFFSRPCPTCNRTTRILIRYLGMKVRCRHCGRVSLATDPDAESAALDDPVNYWSVSYTHLTLPTNREV